MMTPIDMFILLVVHYIGDFLLQSRDMGRKKSSSNYWLSLHVIMYSLFLAVCIPALQYESSIQLMGVWVIINGTLHWTTDYFTSRLSGYLYKNDFEYLFWGMIGLDQLIHSACLIFTYQYLFY